MQDAVTIGMVLLASGSIVALFGKRLLGVIDKNTDAIEGMSGTLSKLTIHFDNHKERLSQVQAEMERLRNFRHTDADRITALTLTVQMLARKQGMRVKLEPETQDQ